MTTAMHAAIAAIPPTVRQFDRARMLAMLLGYATSWDDEPVTVLSIEEEFQAPLIHPSGAHDPDWLLGGKIDLMLRWPTGRTLIVDHKSSSEDVSPGSTFRARLGLQGQASQYYEGAAALGYPVDGFMFDVLVKPALKPLQITQRRAVPESPQEYQQRCVTAIAADPAKYLARIEVSRYPTAQREYRETLSTESILIDTVREHGLVSMNEDACHSYGRPCEYYEVCTGLARIDDPERYTYDDGHAELGALPVPVGRRLLTNSRRKTFNACRQKHHYRYELGAKPVQRSDALSFGDALHKSLEAYWTHRLQQQRRAA